jgi:curved DNA-binding protein CbpA
MTLYEVLGVSVEASEEEIKAAYRRRVKETHPDASGGGDPAAFRQVQHAYEVLGDEACRAKYDREGEEPAGAAMGPTPTGILVEAFWEILNMLESVGSVSPIDLTRLALQERAKVELAHEKKHGREIQRWRAILDKLERKAGAEAILEHVLQQRIEPHVRAAAEARAWADGCQLALRLLDGYRYRDGASEFFNLADVLAGLEEDEGNGSGKRPASRRRKANHL